MKEDPRSIKFSCIKVTQPIGTFYIASINYKDLRDITFFDVRRILGEREIETYLGIQRPLTPRRVEEIKKYVNTVDATFPTAIIIAVEAVCATYDESASKMTLSNYLEGEKQILFRDIARVLDGQHRLEGLDGYDGDTFELNVALFISIDISEQANIFSTVNLAQTKVNRSLAYDLFELAKSRSPQKTCHNIAVALDQNSKSPFYERIKRLGVATEGRFSETITQATFVESLLPYLTPDPQKDRDVFKRGKKPEIVDAGALQKHVFRNMFLSEKEVEIADVIWNLFDAVREKWPVAWVSLGKGNMLNKTNGFKAIMRFLRPAYLYLTAPGGVPKKGDFLLLINRASLTDADFNVDRFRPGTSGESDLYRTLLKECRLD